MRWDTAARMFPSGGSRDAERVGGGGNRRGIPRTLSPVEVSDRLAFVGLESRWAGAPPSVLEGITIDSRKAGPGDLFCALAGLRTDGHLHVAEAEARGAEAALVERRVTESSLPQLIVADTRTAVAHLASLFHGDPSEAMRIVAVTGTNGKTTTAWLAREMLQSLGPAATLGTLGTVGPNGERTGGDLTTPGPVELMAALADFRRRDARYVALELSSHALDQRRADGLSLSHLIFTNLTREHLKYHSDMQAYRAAKLRAVTLVRSGGTCVANAEDPAWAGVDPGDGRLLTYGVEPGAEVRALDPRLEEGGSRWRLASEWGDADVVLPLPGRYNIYNALAAAGVALVEGMEPGAVAERLGRIGQVPGRMEILRRRPPRVVRDYAHTPDALRRVLESLRASVSGRLLVVFGCGGDRDRGKRPRMGAIADEVADFAIVTTDNPRSEDPAEIARAVVERMRTGRYEIVLDRREAIGRALEKAGREDLVLLAGKGHERYQEVTGDKLPFDEKSIVEELTRKRDEG